MFGGGWYTALYLANTTAAAASPILNFVAENGSPLAVTLPGLGSNASHTIALNARATAIVELPNAEHCCGFGGTFAVKLPDVSVGIVEEKIKNTVASGARVLIACDSSCLMHIAGAMSRQGVPCKTMHLAEVLAQGLE